ncbi:MAG: DUF2723 domain-containing protein [Candidatus Sumerlaeia bacterium]|nr:DUF2723 domain-containing protein [Candidatus Sumerlaeia bacterium]
MSERRTGMLMMIFVPLVAVVVYSTTICPTIYWGDGIELTCVAAVLGVAHPTGYPLYSLLGHLFTRIPLGTIAFRMNLMSLATGSVLAALVAWLVWRLLRHSRPRQTSDLSDPADLSDPSDPTDKKKTKQPAIMSHAAFAAGAGWCTAFSQTFWYHAGLSEVYLLNAAIVAGVLNLILSVVLTRDRRWFIAACFLCALGMGNHTMAGMLLMPVLAVVGGWMLIPPRPEPTGRKRKAIPAREPLQRRLTRLVLPALLAGIAGLSVYLYLPLRAAQNPPLNWGDPSNMQRFLWSVRGGEFRKFYLLKVPQWLFPDRPIVQGTPFDSETYPVFLRYRLREWLEWMGGQLVVLHEAPAAVPILLGCLVLFGAILGWRILWRGQPLFAASLAIVVAMNAVAVMIYSIHDIEGYFFPAHVIVILCLVVAAAQLHRWAESRLLAHSSALLACLMMALPVGMCLRGRAAADHSGYTAAERYGRDVLERLPFNALILTAADYDIEPLWYQQIVEHRRRDVVVFGRNFLATPGYGKYFEGRYDPPVAFRTFAETPTEEEFFRTMAHDIVAPNLQRRPVFATWYDPRIGAEAERIEIPLLRDPDVAAVKERIYFPEPDIYRLKAK